MAADITTSLKDWSTTEASNSPSGSTAISTNLDDNLRAIQTAVRYMLARDTIASATTCDLGSKDSQSLSVTGTTTITGLGTVSEGIRKKVFFAGALTLTHNATSLILPGGASITTAAGDTAEFESEGSGNWRCLWYTRASGAAVVSGFVDGSAASPSIYFGSDTDTGLYRSGTNTLNVSAGGASRVSISDTAIAINSATTTTIQPTAATTGSANDVIIGGGNSTGSNQAGDVLIKPGLPASGSAFGDVEIWGRSSAGAVKAFARFDGPRRQIIIVDPLALSGPSISSGGGTSPTIVGSDVAFKITLGTTPGSTDVVVAFGSTWDEAPIVSAQYQSGDIRLAALSTTTTLTIEPSSSMANGGIIDVICIGRAGG